MKTKIIFLFCAIAITAGLLSFKNLPGPGNIKTVTICVNDRFILINNGEDETEKRPLVEKIKVMDQSTWSNPQPQLVALLNEYRAKGYRYAGSAPIYALQVMILERE